MLVCGWLVEVLKTFSPRLQRKKQTDPGNDWGKCSNGACRYLDSLVTYWSMIHLSTTLSTVLPQHFMHSLALYHNVTGPPLHNTSCTPLFFYHNVTAPPFLCYFLYKECYQADSSLYSPWCSWCSYKVKQRQFYSTRFSAFCFFWWDSARNQAQNLV